MLKNFVTRNEDFVARFFGYSSKYELFEDTKDLRNEPSAIDTEEPWLYLNDRRIGDKKVSVYVPNGGSFGPWNIQIEYDFSTRADRDWATCDQLPKDWGQCRKVPAHLARKIFRFDGEEFSVVGTTIIRDLSPNRWVYLDLSFDEEGKLVIDCNVVDKFEFEGPIRPRKSIYDEDIPF